METFKLYLAGKVVNVAEAKMTPDQMKKREKIAKSIERDNPDMPMDKKMAIATKTAMNEKRGGGTLPPIPALTKAKIKHTHSQSSFKQNKTMVGVSDKDYDKAKKIVGNMPNVMLHSEENIKENPVAAIGGAVVRGAIARKAASSVKGKTQGNSNSSSQSESVNEIPLSKSGRAPGTEKLLCEDCGCQYGNIDPNCDCPNDGSDPKAEHWVKDTNEARQLKNKDKEMMVTKPGASARRGGGVITIDKKDWPQFKKRGYVQAENVKQPYLDEASLHRMNLIKKIAKHGSPKVKAALKAPSRVDNNKKKDPNNRNEAFKVKDIVIPKIGPHKGVKHTIIHDFGNGTYNVSPIGLSAKQTKYRMGATKAKGTDLKLTKEEVEVNERNYRKEYDNYQGRPEQIANRSSRNSARRIMGDDAIKGMDVGHKDNNPLNNDPSNLQMEEPSENRREPRLRDEGKSKPVSQMTPKEKAANDKRRKEYKAYQKKLRGGESVEENYLDEGKMKDLAMKIDRVVSNMKKDRIMKPFADKFKKDAMKSLDIRKSLEKILPDYVAGKMLDKVMKEDLDEKTKIEFKPNPADSNKTMIMKKGKEMGNIIKTNKGFQVMQFDKPAGKVFKSLNDIKPAIRKLYGEEVEIDEASKEGTIKIIKTKDNKFQVQRMTKGKFVDQGKPYKSLKDAEKVRSGGQHSMQFSHVEEKYTGGNRRDWHKDYDFDQDRDIVKGFVSPKAKNLAKRLVKKGEPMVKATKNIKRKFPSMSLDSITDLLKSSGIKESRNVLSEILTRRKARK